MTLAELASQSGPLDGLIIGTDPQPQRAAKLSLALIEIGYTTRPRFPRSED